jgi:exoribonuclease-2
MLERGLRPDFSAAALAEVDRMQAPTSVRGESIRDLTGLLWTSIDNDDSLDLDQLTVAEALPGDQVTIRVAVADVDVLVKNGSAIDEHARYNTTSVYTAAEIFPMLPDKLSTDLTSLNFEEDRLAVVVEMVIGADGSLQGSNIYRARVRNHAKLAYNSVAAWLEGNGAVPEEISTVVGLAENLRLQDRACPESEELAARPRSAEPGNHRGKTGLRRRPNPRSRGRRKEPRQGDRRGFHDRSQRCDRSLSRGTKIPFHPPCSTHT